MKISYSLTLPAEAQSVPTARSLCRANLALLLVDGESIDDVTLALTEACSNVVRHADAHSFDVEVSVVDSLCRIDVIDGGKGFEPEAVGFEEVDELLADGRGMGLIQALVDGLQFTQRDGQGTVLSFEKRVVLLEGSPLIELAG